MTNVPHPNPYDILKFAFGGKDAEGRERVFPETTSNSVLENLVECWHGRWPERLKRVYDRPLITIFGEGYQNEVHWVNGQVLSALKKGEQELSGLTKNPVGLKIMSSIFETKDVSLSSKMVYINGKLLSEYSKEKSINFFEVASATFSDSFFEVFKTKILKEVDLKKDRDKDSVIYAGLMSLLADEPERFEFWQGLMAEKNLFLWDEINKTIKSTPIIAKMRFLLDGYYPSNQQTSHRDWINVMEAQAPDSAWRLPLRCWKAWPHITPENTPALINLWGAVPGVLSERAGYDDFQTGLNWGLSFFKTKDEAKHIEAEGVYALFLNEITSGVDMFWIKKQKDSRSAKLFIEKYQEWQVKSGCKFTHPLMIGKSLVEFSNEDSNFEGNDNLSHLINEVSRSYKLKELLRQDWDKENLPSVYGVLAAEFLWCNFADVRAGNKAYEDFYDEYFTRFSSDALQNLNQNWLKQKTDKDSNAEKKKYSWNADNGKTSDKISLFFDLVGVQDIFSWSPKSPAALAFVEYMTWQIAKIKVYSSKSNVPETILKPKISKFLTEVHAHHPEMLEEVALKAANGFTSLVEYVHQIFPEVAAPILVNMLRKNKSEQAAVPTSLSQNKKPLKTSRI